MIKKYQYVKEKKLNPYIGFVSFQHFRNDELYEKTFQTDIDIRKWIQGKYQENIEIFIPEKISTGVYELQVGIGGNNKPSVVFTTNAKQDGDYSVLTKMELI